MEIINLLFKVVERIKDHVYRNKYVCIEISEEIFTKILTVVIFGWQIYEYIFCFLYADLDFLIFIN